jgi:hypothetical protein
MNIADKFKPLFNQLNGSIKIRQRIAKETPEPTIEMAHQALFKRINSQDMYIEKLYEIMTTRHIDKFLHDFYNTPISAAWVHNHLEESERSLNMLPKNVNKHLEKIKLFAVNNGLDINENLNNMSAILKEYENDPKLQVIRKLLQDKKDVIQEFIKAFDDCSFKIKKTIDECSYIPKNNSNEQYNSSIDDNPDLLEMKTFINEKATIFENNRTNKEPYWFDYTVVENYIDRLNHENIQAFLKIRATEMDLSLADNFIRDKSKLSVSNDIAGFLQNKIDEESDHKQGIKLRIDFDNYRTQEIILFVDDSMLGKRNDGSYFDIFSKKHLQTVHDSIMAEYIRNIFNKNPTVAKNFIEIFQKGHEISALSIKRILPSIETYSNNLEFFNNKPFDLKAEFDESFARNRTQIYRVYEDLDDKMNRKIKDHKVQQLAHSIASNKYRGLYDNESYKIIENIYDLNLKTDVFQDYIGKKIAAYKTPEQFNEGLSSFLKSFNGFDMQSMLLKAENAGVQIISESDDILIIEVENYEQSKLLGSSSWCIVRDEQYFNSYTEGGNKQYFLYDFSCDSSDNNSMIGFTLDYEGEHYAAHYKDDDEVNENESILAYAHDIINELKERLHLVRTTKNSMKNA